MCCISNLNQKIGKVRSRAISGQRRGRNGCRVGQNIERKCFKRGEGKNASSLFGVGSCIHPLLHQTAPPTWLVFLGSADRGIAVGTRVTPRPPHRTVRAAFPHTAPTSVFDGEPRVGPWVKDAWFGKIVLRQPLHPFERGEVFLAAPPERAPPELPNALAENPQRRVVRRHCEVVEEAVQNLAEPLSRLRDRLVPSLTQFLLHFAELRPHAVAPALPP